jgi:hypothetical protein
LLALSALLAALAFAGCGNSPHHPPTPASVALGTSAVDGTGFYPLTGEQPLVPGSQGGFHVWLKFRVEGMAPGSARVHRTARRVSDDRLLLTAESVEELGAPDGSGWWETPKAVPNFMCPPPIGVEIIGQPVVFDVAVHALDGALLAEGSAEATPYCQDGDTYCPHRCAAE